MEEIIFSNYKISTITYLGSVYDIPLDYDTKIKIFDLANNLQLDNNITFIKYVDKFRCKLKYSDEYLINRNIKYKNPWYNKALNRPVLVNTNLKIGHKRYTYIKKSEFIIIEIIKGNKYKKRKKRGIKLDLKNSITIEIRLPCPEARIANCKICTNGHMQITGCQNDTQCQFIIDKLRYTLINIAYINEKNVVSMSQAINDIDDNTHVAKHILLKVTSNKDLISQRYISLKDIKVKYPEYYNPIKEYIIGLRNHHLIKKKLIFSHKVCPKSLRIVCMMAHLHIEKPGFIQIDQIKMFKYIESLDRQDLFVVFENIKNKSLRLDYTSKNGIIITYIIFRSGKINMTNIRDYDHAKEGYKFITGLIRDNIDKFKLVTTLDKAIGLIRDRNKYGEQRSEKWIKSRKYAVTASDVASIIMKNPPYETYNEYIKKKALKIKGLSQFQGNIYTKLGQRHEYICQQLIIRLENNNEKKKYKALFYETGIYFNDDMTIGGSPDGLILKFEKNSQIDYRSNMNINLLNNLIEKGKMLDACLLEIKCPSNYKPVKRSLREDKEHYYWQIQQQLYVTGLKYCIFMNNQFIIYNNEQEFLEDKTTTFKGVYLVVLYFDKGERLEKTIYPSDVLNHKCVPILKKAAQDSIKNIISFDVVYWKLNNFDVSEIDYNEEYEKYIPKILKAREEFIKYSETL